MSIPSISAKDVEHHPEKNCFTVTVNGKEAVLQYRLTGEQDSPGSVDFTHTFVPPELRGQGLAESLVRCGLAWAREQNHQIHASCWYAAKFLR
jgi:uncharacterized protein